MPNGLKKESELVFEPQPTAWPAPREDKNFAFLAGKVIDIDGRVMAPIRLQKPGGPRFYTSDIAGDNGQRISVLRLDSRVAAILCRIHLLQEDWSRDDLVHFLRRVMILDHAIVLQLCRRACLTAWRSREPALRRLSNGEILRLVQTCLIRGEEMVDVGTTLCLSSARYARARKIRSEHALPPAISDTFRAA